MARDFESLIVDPSLVDPSIDTSNLRTTTDTREELLAATPEFTGIQFDPTNINYLDDLYALYSGQLPMIPVTPAATTPAVGSPTSGGGGGGGTPATGSGGQATGGTTISPTTQPVDPSGMLPQISSTIQPTTGGFLASGAAGGASLGNLDLNNIDLGNPTGDSRVVPEEQGLSGTPSYVDPIMDSNLMAIRQQQNIEGLTAPEQNLVNQAFSKVGATVDNVMDDLSKIPGAVADFANKTVDIAGQKINVGETLLKAGINKLAGGPITLVTSALQALPKSKSQKEYEGYTDAQKGVIDEAYSSGGIMEGYNQVSGFGKGVAGSVQDRIDNIEARKNAGKTYSQTNLDKLKELQDKANLKETTDDDDPGGSIEPSGLDTITGPNIDEDPDPVGDDPGGDGKDDGPGPGPSGPTGNYEGAGVGGPAGQGSPQSTGPTGKGGGADAGTGSFGNENVGGSPTGISGPPGRGGTATTGPSGPPSQGGGGGGGGDRGKIVCTMMNESYGFGSFRNKIWLRHSKDLAPEYQKGYHKIFLPLVKLSKTNKILKKTLEHIAVHRTIDIRQESRGKMHLLGRVYRKILEPICYWVGRHG